MGEVPLQSHSSAGTWIIAHSSRAIESERGRERERKRESESESEREREREIKRK